MTDFAFRPGALTANATLRRSSSGLWSFEADVPRQHITKLGFLSKAHAKALGEHHLLEVYGRVPKYMHED